MTGECSAPRSRASHRAMLRCLGHTASIAFAWRAWRGPTGDNLISLVGIVCLLLYIEQGHRWPDPLPIAVLAGLLLHNRHMDRASGMSASGQDPQGLEAKPASPTAESGDAKGPPPIARQP